MIRTAVVILNYNGEKLLREFLPSVIKHSSPQVRVIVADNGSTDESVVLLKAHFPSVEVIELPANYGFCKGYNEALRQISADIYVLLNSDVEVTQGWLEPILDLFINDPSTVAIQPKILSYRNREKFEYAGAGGGFIDSLGYPFCRGRIFDYVEKDAGQYNDTTRIFWSSGACMAIRSETFHELGGFDEDFFAHMEEIDLCWRIHRTGRKVMYCGKSTVYHLGAGTLGYSSPRKTFLNFRNNLSMLYKQLDTHELFGRLALRLLLDWLAALSFLVKKQPANAWAVIRAHIAFCTLSRKNNAKRKLLRKTYPIYSRVMIYQGSILYAYYVQKKRTIHP